MTEQRLPENYIDSNLSSRDQELLRIFNTASLSEGGSADEVTLRGILAIIDWQLEQVIQAWKRCLWYHYELDTDIQIIRSFEQKLKTMRPTTTTKLSPQSRAGISSLQ